jgi:hypothetical protein
MWIALVYRRVRNVNDDSHISGKIHIEILWGRGRGRFGGGSGRRVITHL